MSEDYPTSLESLAEDRDDWMNRAKEAESDRTGYFREMKSLQSKMLDARRMLQHMLWFYGCKDRHGIGAAGDIISDVECLRQLLAVPPSGKDPSDG